MTLTPKGIMKRTYRDGQYSVIRKSSWLLHVTIEGPLGERAGNGFLTWLNDLPMLHNETQYILLDVTNIGPVAEGLIEQLVQTIEKNDIGILSILGGENTKNNMAPLIRKSEDTEKIGYFTDLPAAHRFPQQVYDSAKTVPIETISERQSESSPPRT